MFYFKYSSRYSEDISIICAFDKTTSELTLEIGLELTNKLSSIFKFYETTFLNLSFDWIESHALSAKITKSTTNSGIIKVDSRATRHSDGQEVWHMEVSGGPCKTIDLHTLGDTKKTMRMDVLNLIGILRNHFDCDINLATKIKVFCTQVISK